MLKIGNGYYNPMAIRRLGLSNRNNLIITFTNGEIDHTDQYYSEYSFEELVESWEKQLRKIGE